jgi:hypothetical protein
MEGTGWRWFTLLVAEYPAATVLTKPDQQAVDLPDRNRQHDRGRSNGPPARKNFRQNLHAPYILTLTLTSQPWLMEAPALLA